MNIVCENWLKSNINEVKSLQYDCYIYLELLVFMMTSFVVRFNFIFMMFWVPVVKFGMNPMEEALGPTLTVGPNISLRFMQVPQTLCFSIEEVGGHGNQSDFYCERTVV